MFVIQTPDGPIDIDDPSTRQERYNRMMEMTVKELSDRIESLERSKKNVIDALADHNPESDLALVIRSAISE
jgi:hypothetical protein